MAADYKDKRTWQANAVCDLELDSRTEEKGDGQSLNEICRFLNSSM